MRKLFCVLTLLSLFWFGMHAVRPAQVAAAKTATVAVVFLGSLEYQQRDYYEIAAETLRKRFDEPKFKLIVGEHPQHVFNRYSDKQGLTPGEVPNEDKLVDFAWTHSFDQVLFLLMTAPSVKSNEITIQWENAEVTLTGRAILIDSRRRIKRSDASTTETVRMYHRSAAKKAVFRKALESLRDQLSGS